MDKLKIWFINPRTGLITRGEVFIKRYLNSLDYCEAYISSSGFKVPKVSKTVIFKNFTKAALYMERKNANRE